MKIQSTLVIILLVIFFTSCSNQEKKIETLVSEAETYEEDKNFSEAIANYNQVIEMDEDSKYQSKIDELQATEEEIYLVKQTMKELEKVLFNPESLQVNEVIISRTVFSDDSEWVDVYMDYSAMNKMGGYARDYANAIFDNKEVKEDGGFFPKFESNYRSGKERIDEGAEDTYYFDLDLLDE